MNVNDFQVVCNRYLFNAREKSKITFYRVDIRDYFVFKKSIGDAQFNNIVTEMGEALQKLQQWGVKVCRKDVDKLVVMVVGDGQSSEEYTCKLILKLLAKKYELADGLNVEININVATGHYPELGKNYNDVDSNLDVCMVVSRRKGVNKYAQYNVKFANESAEEYLFYKEIREAMRAKEFLLFYQPIVNTNNGEVAAGETLIRWNHKTQGVILPEKFLSVMEQTGDINWVGEWCVEEIAKQINEWKNYNCHFSISFNLSERQLLNPDLAESTLKIIQKYRIEPGNICLEISDMAMYDIYDVVKNNINKLSNKGVKICLDGFGSKFFTPIALQDFPLDAIKIDRKFWNDIEKSSIVKNTIKLLTDFAQEKNVMLIALSVETIEEVDLLRNYGINYMQGYFFEKPTYAKDFIGEVMFTPWNDKLHG